MNRPPKNKIKEAGQISIFLGIVMVVIISFLAFIINVGLFVKAKINLQNAVDAAAYSGASVQARQLTNIAYLNWELRNTFKEWMFKYYVLGQKGLEQTERGQGGHPFNNQNMNFRLHPFYDRGENNFDPNAFDKYNIPSICIHFGSPHNICQIVSIPGLPRFETVGLPSISEHHESFLNTLVSTKAKDCSARSQVNMGAAMLWAYGTGFSDIPPNAPQIAAELPGAWIQALELGLRIRNLESIINRPPVNFPICMQQTGDTPCTPIEGIAEQGTSIPGNERTVKAFYSAYRNLGGGAGKESPEGADMLSTSFRLQELRPNPLNVDALSLNGFLIPSETDGLLKHYLDLQVYPLNYATFFTLFTSTSATFKSSTGTSYGSEADCGAIKAALPVPGYISGFTKNPEVLTYYPVKGEAEFVGLFFPFSETRGINLKAYAAAKPMGGRIGPKLFRIDGSSVLPREESEKQLTINYASALDSPSLAAIEAGSPIPTLDIFWANTSTNIAIGGNPTTGNDIFFTVPNLLYDFESVADLSKPEFRNNRIQTVVRAPNFDNAYSFAISEGSGLYDKNQYRLFEANQDLSAGPTMTAKEVLQSLANARRPTRYEALNYLIPVIAEEGTNPANVDHNSYFYFNDTNPNPTTGTRSYNVFGPLYGPDVLYNEIAAVTNVVNSYIQANTTAIENYINALKAVSDKIRADSARATDSSAYNAAADSIYREPLLLVGNPGEPTCDSPSLAQTFHTFFLGNTKACGITPLSIRVTEYFNEENLRKGDIYRNYYTQVYESRGLPAGSASYLMSGYVPGNRQGAGDAGEMARSNGSFSMKRNFYSTKIFAMQKVVANSASKARLSDQQGFDSPSVFMEGGASGASFSAPADFLGIPVHNLLQIDDFSEYPFLDF